MNNIDIKKVTWGFKRLERLEKQAKGFSFKAIRAKIEVWKLIRMTPQEFAIHSSNLYDMEQINEEEEYHKNFDTNNGLIDEIGGKPKPEHMRKHKK